MGEPHTASPDVPWTPGPWALSNGNLVRVHPVGSGACVAGVHRIGKARDCIEAEAVCVANGRLIAAAPDLASSLSAMIDRYGESEDGPEHPVVVQARAVLAKARGL